MGSLANIGGSIQSIHQEGSFVNHGGAIGGGGGGGRGDVRMVQGIQAAEAIAGDPPCYVMT